MYYPTKTKEDKAFNQAILLASQSMEFDFLCDDELLTISESNAFPFSISVGRRFVIIPKNIKYGLYTFYVDGVSRFNHGMIIYPHNWKEDVIKVHNTIVKELSEYKLTLRNV